MSDTIQNPTETLTAFCRRFDHAVLHSSATESEILQACAETREYGFFGLAVNPTWNALVAKELNDSSAGLVGVSGFPLGAASTKQKVAESLEGAEAGAVEIDTVANIGWLAQGSYNKAEVELREIRWELPAHIPLKVIIEAPQLNEAQIQAACEVVIQAGAEFVKTATGFFGGTTEDIVHRVMQFVDGRTKVKASGGIRTLEQASSFLSMGVERLGSSASVRIVDEFKKDE